MPNQVLLPLKIKYTDKEKTEAIKLIPALVKSFKVIGEAYNIGYFDNKKFEHALDDISQAMFEDVVTVMTVLHPDIADKYYTEFFPGDFGYDPDIEDGFEKLYGI